MARRNDSQAVQLSRGALREVARQTKRLERAYYNTPDAGYRPRTQQRVVLKAIVTSATITACSGTTPGTGTATLYYWNGTSMDTGESVDVLNWFTGYAPSSGSHVKIYWEDNAYWLGPGDC